MKGVAAICTAVAVLACAQAAPGAGLAHVTVIGDSVADGISGDSASLTILHQGLDVDLETAPCRRVDAIGCPVLGVIPSSVVQLAKSLGPKLGPYVVVSVGYNDFEDQYAAEVEHALSVFAAEGVQHVWWLNLRAVRHPYLAMNADLQAAAAHHPQLTIVDWNVYARSHPEWFQDDGLHLLQSGSQAMARLIHDTLAKAGVALPAIHITTAAMPVARVHKTYRAQLGAAGGDPPLRWSLLDAPPAGIHLLAGGRLDGKPRKRGTFTLRVEVKDAQGFDDTRTLTLRVR